MQKNNKKEKKQVCINLPVEVYDQLEKKAEKRKLDKTNYITYLVQNDKDDMYSENAARIINNISCATEKLLPYVKEDDKIRPFVIDIRDGVKELWRYLR